MIKAFYNRQKCTSVIKEETCIISKHDNRLDWNKADLSVVFVTAYEEKYSWSWKNHSLQNKSYCKNAIRIKNVFNGNL